jgi:hypothetical protein
LNCWSLDAPVPAWGQLTATTVGPLNALAIAVASGKDVKASLATAHSATNAVIQAYKG